MKIKDYRLGRRKKMTQEELAAKVGVPASVIVRLEQGLNTNGRHWARIMKATKGKLNPIAEYGEELDL